MLKGLSRYRDELKGFAILWIVAFHVYPLKSNPLYQLTRFGYGGVDIFMLLTGFGLYYSLQKSSDLGGYVKRRAARLLPAYLPFCVLWLCVMLLSYDYSRMDCLHIALGNLLMIGQFVRAPMLTSWYTSLLVVSILLAPFVYASLSAAKKPMCSLIVWFVAMMLVSVAFWGSGQTLVFTRLPIFVLGMGLASPALNDPERRPKLLRDSRARVLLGLLAILVGFAILYFFNYYKKDAMSRYGMYWYPFLLIAPPLCAGLCRLFKKAEKLKGALAILRVFGAASFEIFLFNCWAEIGVPKTGWPNTTKWRLVYAALSVMLGVAYHYGVKAITKRVAKRQQAAV